MNLPTGQLVRSRVVDDPSGALAAALDRELTGYCVLAPQDALLLDDGSKGVLTFEAGVPVVVYHVGSDRGGPAALADLAMPGPYSADLFELDATDLTEVHDTPELAVPPGMPAERLAGDPALAERTRAAAPDDRRTGATAREDGPESAVEAFLADEGKVEAIREQARTEARQRAEAWGLEDELADLQAESVE